MNVTRSFETNKFSPYKFKSGIIENFSGIRDFFVLTATAIYVPSIAICGFYFERVCN